MKHLLSGIALAALLAGTAPVMAQGTDTGQIGPGVSKGSPGSTVVPQSNANGIPPNSTLDPTGTSSTSGTTPRGMSGTSSDSSSMTGTGRVGPGVSKGSPGSTASGSNANGIPPNAPHDPTGTSSTMGSSTSGNMASPSDTTGHRSGMSGSSTMDHHTGMSGTTHHRMHSASGSMQGRSDNTTTEELNRQELSRIEQSNR